MASNEEDNWFAEYHIGKMTGLGMGPYGAAGNLEYQQEQQAKRSREESDRQQKQWQKKETSPVSFQPPPAYPSAENKSWSNKMAILGFLGGAGAIYSQPEPSFAAAVITGLISAFVFGRFYKAVLVVALVLFVLWLLL